MAAEVQVKLRKRLIPQNTIKERMVEMVRSLKLPNCTLGRERTDQTKSSFFFIHPSFFVSFLLFFFFFFLTSFTLYKTTAHSFPPSPKKQQRYYGGGGGGGINANAPSHATPYYYGGTGGLGGGGKGSSIYTDYDGLSGTPGSGGGGGGTDPEWDVSGNGGSGIVVVHHEGSPCFSGLKSECECSFDGVNTTYKCFTSVTSTSFVGDGCMQMHESSSGSLFQNIPTVRLSLTSTKGFPNDFSADDIDISGGGSISDFMEVNSDGEIAFTFTAQV